MINPPLKLMTSMATRDWLRELTAIYQTSSSQPVVNEAAGGVDVAKRVHAGESVDVVVLPRSYIDKLAADGKVDAASCVDLVRSGIAVAVPAGAPQPDISNEAAVRQAVQSAKTLSFSTGPSGVYLEKTFARWGILDRIRPRISVPPPGVSVGSLVATGKVELGFQQLSELMDLDGVSVVGMLPQDLQSMTTYSGAVASVSTAAAAARSLLEYMASPERAALKARYGMEPGTV